MTNYKEFQQVLNFAIRPRSNGGAGKSAAPKRSTGTSGKTKSATNKRTKTGCLTCRKRKKKCDEDKVDGKCQACTRNFLECCWPETGVVSGEVSGDISAATVAVKQETPIVTVVKMEESCCSEKHKHDYEVSPRLPSLEEQLQLKTPPLSPVSMAASIYPSPTSSPKLYQNGYRRVSHESIKPIVLPPIRCNQYKVSKAVLPKTTMALTDKQTKFVVTSFNKDKDLVHVPTV